MRAAIIEIGSRAVRLLVAQVDGSRERVLKTDTKLIGLADAFGSGRNDLTDAIRKLNATIASMVAEAKRHSVERVHVFGTEALRSIQAKAPQTLELISHHVEVLSKSQEAILSFSAAVTDPEISASSGRQYVVIDIGGGSIEIVAGSIKDAKPNPLRHTSLNLGISHLRSVFQSFDFSSEKFQQFVKSELSGHKIPAPGVGAKTILLGSAPTKAAWLKNRPSQRVPYNPRLVGGIEISRDEIYEMVETLVRLWKNSAEEARTFVDFRITDDSEIMTVICGLSLVHEVLVIQNRKNCVISTRGVRFGYLRSLF